MQPKISSMMLILTGLNVADWITTLFHQSMGAAEANPLSRKLIEKGLFNEVKVALSAGYLGIAIAAYYAEQKYLPQAERPELIVWNIAYAIIFAIVILYTTVVVNNLILIYFLSEEAG